MMKPYWALLGLNISLLEKTKIAHHVFWKRAIVKQISVPSCAHLCVCFMCPMFAVFLPSKTFSDEHDIRDNHENVEGCWGHWKGAFCALVTNPGGPICFIDTPGGAECALLTLPGSPRCFIDIPGGCYVLY